MHEIGAKTMPDILFGLMQLKRMANHFKTKRDAMSCQLLKQAQEQKVKDFDNDRHHVKAYSKLSDNFTKPITFLKRDAVARLRTNSDDDPTQRTEKLTLVH